MGLLSFLRKNKPESRSDSTFQSRAEEDSDAVRNRGKRKSGKDRKTPDPVLPEKKRARRRLVGAVALVMAAVVGLPMILDSEPKPVTDDIAIDIPSKDKRTQGGAVRTAPPLADVARAPAGVGLDKDEEVIDPATLPPPAETGPSTAARSWSSRNRGPGPNSGSTPSLKVRVRPKPNPSPNRRPNARPNWRMQSRSRKPMKPAAPGLFWKAGRSRRQKPKPSRKRNPDVSWCRLPPSPPRTRSMNCRAS
jgi:DedD protein